MNRPLSYALAQALDDQYGWHIEVFCDNDAIVIPLSGLSKDPYPFQLVTSENLEVLLRRKLEQTGFFGARFRDELRQQMDGVQFPTDEVVASLSMRWFVTGTGIFIENPTERPFTASAYFSATAEPACGVTVPMRAVPARGSAVVSPQDASECVIDRADVTLTDEYGFLVNQIAVQREERQP